MATSSCYDDCVATWPALTVEAASVGGAGLEARWLATTERKDGTTQVTYKGMPMYYFSGDQQPGDTNGQGSWSLVHGHARRRAEIRAAGDDSTPGPDASLQLSPTRPRPRAESSTPRPPADPFPLSAWRPAGRRFLGRPPAGCNRRVGNRRWSRPPPSAIQTRRSTAPQPPAATQPRALAGRRCTSRLSVIATWSNSFDPAQ